MSTATTTEPVVDPQVDPRTDPTIRPTALSVLPDGIPQELKDHDCWFTWGWVFRKKEGRWTKPPTCARTGGAGKSNDSATYSDYETALAAFRDPKKRYDGIGFAVTADDDYVGWDFDHARNAETGVVEEWALDYVRRLNTYTEVSPSGTGIRVFARGKLPPTGRVKGDVECYESGRYLTTTGHHLEGTPTTIEERTAEMTALHLDVFGEQPEPKPPRAASGTRKGKAAAADGKDREPLSQADLDRLEQARNGKNGDRFRALYDQGDWAGCNYPSQNEADGALADELGFWFPKDGQRDEDEIDRMFRHSALMRPKWDERRGGQTYGQKTIALVMDRADCYAPPGVQWKPADGNGDGVGDEEEEEPPPPPAGGGAAGAAAVGKKPPRKVKINSNDENLPVVTKKVWDTLLRQNDPPRLFRCGGVLTEVDEDDEGRPLLLPMSEARLRGELGRQIDWFRMVRDQKSKDPKAKVPAPAIPPPWVMQEMLSRIDPRFPVLNGVCGAPVFAPDGTLHDQPGYHAGTRLFYSPEPGFTVPPVSRNPTTAERRRARDLLVTDLLGDFGFRENADLANAIALLLWGFASPLIGGGGPFHMIEKPVPGSGAGLLAFCCTLPALGKPAPVMPAADSEREWRLKITATLLERPQVIFIDNIRGRLDSGSLAAAITGEDWSDRILGVSQNARLPVKNCWIGTGNNPTMHVEIARRRVLIRLDTGLEQPELRDPQTFTHPDLKGWVRKNRGQLVWAALTLIQAWLAADCPRPAKPAIFGSFEKWVEVMDGILHHAGIHGFMANYAEANAGADPDRQGWKNFVEAWFERHGSQEVGVAQLFRIVTHQQDPGPDGYVRFTADSGEPPMVNLGKATSELAQRIALGSLLPDHKDQRFGNLSIRQGGLKQRARQWWLEVAKDPHGTGPVGDRGGQASESAAGFDPDSLFDSPAENDHFKHEMDPESESSESSESKRTYAGAQETSPNSHPPRVGDPANAHPCMGAGFDSLDSPDSPEGPDLSTNGAIFGSESTGESTGESKPDSPDAGAGTVVQPDPCYDCRTPRFLGIHEACAACGRPVCPACSTCSPMCPAGNARQDVEAAASPPPEKVTFHGRDIVPPAFDTGDAGFTRKRKVKR